MKKKDFVHTEKVFELFEKELIHDFFFALSQAITDDAYTVYPSPPTLKRAPGSGTTSGNGKTKRQFQTVTQVFFTLQT